MSRKLLKQCLDLIADLDKEGLILESGLIFALRNELAKPEQTMTPISPDQYERLCFTCGACTGKPWVGLTKGELIDIQNCNRGFWTNAAKIEQLLKDKNT